MIINIENYCYSKNNDNLHDFYKIHFDHSVYIYILKIIIVQRSHIYY